jgi:ElaB/YqjD/DUF883 family membrane-anchored ribosome-binding protein
VEETNQSSVEDLDTSRSNSETERVVQILHAALERFAQHAAQAEQRLKNIVAEARHKVASSRSEAAASVVEDYVDRHPWASVGIAFGAGLVIASLLRR